MSARSRAGKRLMTPITLVLVLMAVGILLPLTSAAAERNDNYGLSPSEAMLIDGLVVRPIMLVGTAVGLVTFIGTLPFTLMSDSVDEAGQYLVVEPAEFTFTRPLGELD